MDVRKDWLKAKAKTNTKQTGGAPVRPSTQEDEGAARASQAEDSDIPGSQELHGEPCLTEKNSELPATHLKTAFLSIVCLPLDGDHRVSREFLNKPADLCLASQRNVRKVVRMY